MTTTTIFTGRPTKSGVTLAAHVNGTRVAKGRTSSTGYRYLVVYRWNDKVYVAKRTGNLATAEQAHRRSDRGDVNSPAAVLRLTRDSYEQIIPKVTDPAMTTIEHRFVRPDRPEVHDPHRPTGAPVPELLVCQNRVTEVEPEPDAVTHALHGPEHLGTERFGVELSTILDDVEPMPEAEPMPEPDNVDEFTIGCECEQDWNCPLHGGTSRPTWIERRFTDDEPDYGGAFDGFAVYSDADPGL